MKRDVGLCESSPPPTWPESALLVVIELCMAVGAILGGRALIHDAAGFGVRKEWLRFGVFHDYTVPGAILMAGVGGAMVVAALLALARSRLTYPAAMAAGITLLGFLAVETAMLGYHGTQQAVLLMICSSAGLALVLLGRRGLVAGRRSPR